MKILNPKTKQWFKRNKTNLSWLFVGVFLLGLYLRQQGIDFLTYSFEGQTFSILSGAATGIGTGILIMILSIVAIILIIFPEPITTGIGLTMLLATFMLGGLTSGISALVYALVSMLKAYAPWLIALALVTLIFYFRRNKR